MTVKDILFPCFDEANDGMRIKGERKGGEPDRSFFCMKIDYWAVVSFSVSGLFEQSHLPSHW